MVYFQVSPVGFDCGKDKNNCEKYQEFCKCIGRNGENRAQAFFARRVHHFSDDEKEKIFLQNAVDLLKIPV